MISANRYVAVACLLSFSCTAAADEKPPRAQQGHIKISIYALNPNYLDGTDSQRHQYLQDYYATASPVAPSNHQRHQISIKLKEKQEEQESIEIIPNARLNLYLTERPIKTASKISHAYQMPHVDFLGNCVKTQDYGDRQISETIYGSSIYAYRCPVGELIIVNHELTQMSYTSINELQNAELKNNIKGHLKSHRDNFRNSYSSLSWVENNVLHTA